MLVACLVDFDLVDVFADALHFVFEDAADGVDVFEVAVDVCGGNGDAVHGSVAEDLEQLENRAFSTFVVAVDEDVGDGEQLFLLVAEEDAGAEDVFPDGFDVDEAVKFLSYLPEQRFAVRHLASEVAVGRVGRS
ncbi:MAG: hypothetical protein GTO14_07810, partial [Anaerolineales bacterium]|nr:hypothetical protein [Deltaproteobacteria bacterium]NIS80102.1 hypothetical protein [Anaerolineales bacterium]